MVYANGQRGNLTNEPPVFTSFQADLRYCPMYTVLQSSNLVLIKAWLTVAKSSSERNSRNPQQDINWKYPPVTVAIWSPNNSWGSHTIPRLWIQVPRGGHIPSSELSDTSLTISSYKAPPYQHHLCLIWRDLHPVSSHAHLTSTAHWARHSTVLCGLGDKAGCLWCSGNG